MVERAHYYVARAPGASGLSAALQSGLATAICPPKWSGGVPIPRQTPPAHFLEVPRDATSITKRSLPDQRLLGPNQHWAEAYPSQPQANRHGSRGGVASVGIRLTSVRNKAMSVVDCGRVSTTPNPIAAETSRPDLTSIKMWGRSGTLPKDHCGGTPLPGTACTTTESALSTSVTGCCMLTTYSAHPTPSGKQPTRPFGQPPTPANWLGTSKTGHDSSGPCDPTAARRP